MSKNISEMSEKEQAELLAELQQLRANQDKAKVRAERLRIRNTIMVEKARKANITVTDAEVDAYIKNMKK